jgi:hypothetical protein
MTTAWLVTPNSTVSATANPDFSQVEADVPQLEVNQRFPLFYPEKRPFFLEGGQFFRSPGAMTFVNTRQIVDPDWGVKFTGKSGANTVGLLAAADAAPGRVLDPSHPDSGGDATFFIGRYQRDVGRNSTAGAFYTDRQFGRESNRVAAIDGQVRLNLQTVGFQGGRSWTTTSSGDRLNGTSTYVWYDYVGRHWRLFVNDLEVSSGYRTQTGFLRRAGYHSNSLNGGYEFQAAQPTWWVSVRPFLVARRATTADGRVDDSILDPGVDVRFARNVSLYTYVSRRWDHFGGVPLRGLTYNVSLDVESSKVVTLNSTVRAGRGPFFDAAAPAVGRLLDLSFTVNISPSDRLAQSVLYLQSRLQDRATGAELFDQQILRSRTNFQFTRFHGVRGIAELNTLSGRLSLSVLYSFTPRPNSALYVGYDDLFTDLGEEPGRPGVPRSGYDRLRRTLFVKLALGHRLGG